MDNNVNSMELCKYRIDTAEKTFHIANVCFENDGYKDAVNRSYYATFYALRAVLAIESIDFKRHKDVIAYFNQHYVATEIFEKQLGKRIGRLKTLREDCDYDDFFMIAKQDVKEQLETAKDVIEAVKKYIESI